MPVAVRLDHRAELRGFADALLQESAVALDGAGVDDRCRPCCDLRAQGASPAEIESMTSPAITESCPTRSPAMRPALEWASTAPHVAANGSMPRAISAAITPDKTSPVPAVASWGLEMRLTATRSPSVTIE